MRYLAMTVICFFGFVGAALAQAPGGSGWTPPRHCNWIDVPGIGETPPVLTLNTCAIVGYAGRNGNTRVWTLPRFFDIGIPAADLDALLGREAPPASE